MGRPHLAHSAGRTLASELGGRAAAASAGAGTQGGEDLVDGEAQAGGQVREVHNVRASQRSSLTVWTEYVHRSPCLWMGNQQHDVRDAQGHQIAAALEQAAQHLPRRRHLDGDVWRVGEVWGNLAILSTRNTILTIGNQVWHEGVHLEEDSRLGKDAQAPAGLAGTVEPLDELDLER